MDVVRHEAIADQRQGMELHGLAQEIQIDHSFGIRGENELPSVATLRDMMGNIHRNNTR